MAMVVVRSITPGRKVWHTTCLGHSIHQAISREQIMAGKEQKCALAQRVSDGGEDKGSCQVERQPHALPDKLGMPRLPSQKGKSRGKSKNRRRHLILTAAVTIPRLLTV